MRKNATKTLKNVKKLPSKLKDDKKLQKENDYVQKVKALQIQVLTDYKQIMAFISKQCIEIMGEPPCKYTLVGMGSLARDEITPYSDFEHVLIMKNFAKEHEQKIENVKEYFRWYSTIFHIIVINLQETDLYSVCIPCLNDHSKPGGNWFRDHFTPQGISFDGMMPHACHFPLGKTQETEKEPWKTELIQTVDKMVEFLEVKDIKEGYRLGDLLTKTCFIDGEEIIYQQFSEQVQTALSKDAAEQHVSVAKQLEENLDKFNLDNHLAVFTGDRNINIKQIVYRSITLFISASGRLHDIDKSSGFEIIDGLVRSEIISEFTAHKFSIAVAVACHIRLFYYNSKKKQEDKIYKEGEQGGKEKLKEMTVGRLLANCILFTNFADGKYKFGFL